VRTIPPRRVLERMKSHSVTSCYYNEADFAVVDALTRVAHAKGISNVQVAYVWLLHKGATTLTVGASKLPQLEDAVATTEE
jgi:1-deoxyxylulose-5-phosphate synthase